MRSLRYFGGLLCLASSLLDVVNAGGSLRHAGDLSRRDTNQTELSACQTLDAVHKASNRSVVYFEPLSSDNTHWMSSSNQASTCIYNPASPHDLATAMKIIGRRKIRFAVSCSNHASNQGFSSTPGIHISLHQFSAVKVSPNKTHVDIGGGLNWATVYKALESTGVNVVGGRVAGPGIGGFITGGGGFSWKTNQHGLSGDTLISVDMVLADGTLITASEHKHSDLFWAIRGGGNRFGIIYNFRMRAYPQSPTILAGIAGYTTSQMPALLDAIYRFGTENTDPLAQVIPTINYEGGSLGALVLGVYDGVPGDSDPFAMFNTTSIMNTTFSGFVSLVDSSLEAGSRGAFHSANVLQFSKPVLAQIANQTQYWGQFAEEHSASFISYDVEPFLPYSKHTKPAAWPHSDNPLPVNLYFAWANASDDAFWQQAMVESAEVITETARQDGQKVDDLYIYPNYALASTPSEELFGPNLKKLERVRKRYDPCGVMLLTTYFNF